MADLQQICIDGNCSSVPNRGAYVVVNQLPATGEDGTIYFVDGGSGDVDGYIYTGGQWISITSSGTGPSPYASNPLMDGTASAGTSDDYARGDHRHPTDTSRAPLASPTFTGTPKAPTQSDSSKSDTQIATTAFVQAAINRKVIRVEGLTNNGISVPSGQETYSDFTISADTTENVLFVAQVFVQYSSNATGRRATQVYKWNTDGTRTAQACTDQRAPANGAVTAVCIPIVIRRNTNWKGLSIGMHHNAGDTLTCNTQIRYVAYRLS